MRRSCGGREGTDLHFNKGTEEEDHIKPTQKVQEMEWTKVIQLENVANAVEVVVVVVKSTKYFIAS